MRKIVLVALGMAAVSAGLPGGKLANAADIADWRSDRSFKDEPVYVPRAGFSWTGFYIGGSLGYGWGDSSTFAGSAGAFDGSDGFVVHPGGWMGGLQAGYNWQYDRFLAGIEVDLGALGADDGQSSATAFVETEYGGYGTLTGRLGMVEDRWLFYLKGGLAFANIENRAGAIAGGVLVPTDATSKDELRAGWTIGGGAEFAFHRNWSMKVEYLYMDFGDDGSGNIDGDRFDHSNDLHTLKVGINYHLQQLEQPLR